MGLKVGFAALAEEQEKFVQLNKRDGHPHMLAQVLMRGKRFCLLYPDGKIGFLQRNANYQLNLRFIEFPHEGFSPSDDQKLALEGKLPLNRIMFDGSYTVSEQLPGYLPPPAIHETDEERFRNPLGDWERAVADYLKREPPPMFN